MPQASNMCPALSDLSEEKDRLCHPTDPSCFAALWPRLKIATPFAHVRGYSITRTRKTVEDAVSEIPKDSLWNRL